MPAFSTFTDHLFTPMPWPHVHAYEGAIIIFGRRGKKLWRWGVNEIRQPMMGGGGFGACSSGHGF